MQIDDAPRIPTAAGDARNVSDTWNTGNINNNEDARSIRNIQNAGNTRNIEK